MEASGYIKGLDNNYIAHKIAHAAAGCAAAAANKGKCSDGAIGAAVGEIVGEALVNGRNRQEISDAEYHKILSYSKIVAGSVAALNGGDVDAAANAAQVAVVNNTLNFNSTPTNAKKHVTRSTRDLDLVQLISPASAAALAKDPLHKEAMLIASDLRKMTNVAVIINGLPYIIGLNGSALIPLSGNGIALPLTASGGKTIIKAMTTGAVGAASIDAGIQVSSCKFSGGSNCFSNLNYQRLGVAAGVGALTNAGGSFMASNAGIGQVTSINLLKNSPQLSKFIKNNPEGTMIFLNQTTINAAYKNVGIAIQEDQTKK